MDVAFSYFVFSAVVVVITTIIVQKLVRRLIYQETERWGRLLFVIPEEFTNPFGKEQPHEMDVSAELYRRLHELAIPFGIEIVVHSLGEEIYFYILARHKDVYRVHKLVESLWPNSYLNQSEEYDLWLGHSADINHVKAGYFELKRLYSIPLRTALEGSFEPFGHILRQLSALAPIGEGVALQMLIKPADEKTNLAIGEYINKLEAGQYHQSKHVHEEFLITPDTIKKVKQKVSSPLFAVNARLIATASSGQAERVFKQIGKQIESDSLDSTGQHNQLVLRTAKQLPELINAFLHFEFNESQQITLNAEEIATYCHLPGSHISAAKLKR
jgi:hypothetical protein